jgi:hypothetical protein
MTVLFRIMMMFAGYTAACIAASLVLTIGTLTPDWNEVMNTFGVPSPAVQSAALWAVVALGTVAIFVIGLLPTLLVIVLAEGLALRSAVVYGVIGGLLALAGGYGLDFAGHIAAPNAALAHEREVFAAAGIAGGLVYWLFAGRKAGAWK